MARVILPTDLSKIKALITTLSSKNTALGINSPIKPTLTEHNIVLADNLTNITSAITIASEGDALKKTSENFTQKRDLLADPVMRTIADFAQILKVLYKPAFTNLGEWGYDIIASGKITYPTSGTNRVDLMKKVKDKHDAYATGDSPLQPFITKNNLVLADIVKALEDARDFDTESKTNANLSENNTAKRNELVDNIIKNLQIIAQALMAFYKENPKELGEWGIQVDDSVKPPKEVTSKIKLLDKITINNLIVGGNITNKSLGDAHLYKGKIVEGEPNIIKPGKTFGVPKGYSTVTIYNPSATDTLVIQALRGQ